MQNPQQRATVLAHQAMHAQIALGAPVGDTDYERSQAEYERRRVAMREEGLAKAAAHNRELHQLAQIRKHGGFQNELPF